MGATNAHAAFVVMVTKMEIKWNELYAQRTEKTREVQWEWLKTKMEQAMQETKEARKSKEDAMEGDDKVPKTTVPKEEPQKSQDFEAIWEKPTSRDPKPGSAVIVDDIILSAHTATALLYYFICMVEVLQHHRVTAKLRKTRFFPPRAEFVSVDITKEGNSPAESKHAALRALGRPLLYTDLRMLIGFIGFYRQ
jgi:hypothetical protein